MAGWHSRLAAPCRYWHRTADRLRHVRALPRRAAKMRQRLRSATCGMRRNGEAENQSRLSPVRCGAREDAGAWRRSRSLRMHENGWSAAATLYRLGRERKPVDAPFGSLSAMNWAKFRRDPVPSGPIPTFASRSGSHVCECWDQRTTSKHKVLVEFWKLKKQTSPPPKRYENKKHTPRQSTKRSVWFF